MRVRNATLFTLALIVSLLAAGCRVRSNGIPSNAAVVSVTANPSLAQWLDAAVAKINQSGPKTASGKPVYAQVQYVEAGQAVADMTVSGATLPALWIPDDAVWPGVLAKRGSTDFQANCQSVARSPLVIAMWRPIAESLGWPGRSLGWLDVGSVAADPSSWAYYSGGKYGQTLRVGHTHPGLSASGASTLLAVVQAAHSSTQAVSVEDIRTPIVQASVAAFEGTVSIFSPSTEQLGQTMHQRGIDYVGAAVMYESTLINNGGGGADGLVAVYPFEGTFMATHPACINGGADAETQEAARLLRDALLKADVQQLAINHGLRPADASATLGSPIDAAHGADPAQPKVIFNSPSVDALFAVRDLWQAARKNVNMVMLLDTSGSMRGDKIDSLRDAAVQFVKQMGDEDYLTLVAFSSRPNTLIDHAKVGTARDEAIRQIQGLQARGDTSLYDAIGSATEMIKRTTGSQTTNALVVLTDGLDTSSRRYVFDQALIDAAAANNTTVFTIAYGDDADKELLQRLASQARGNFYLGNEANIASIYQEMSAAFGGSVGIGR
jgi:Ca-activated chloride channel family protein